MIKKLNLSIVAFTISFALISLVSIYSAGLYTSSSLGNLFLKQFVWYGIGAIVFLFIIRFKNNFFYEYAWFLYCFGVLLLLLLLFVGTPINNSKCWFVIPGIGSIQPSEFIKIFLTIVLAKNIFQFRKKYSTPTLSQELLFLFKNFIILLIPTILTFLQPDTGVVIIYFVIFTFMMFFSGVRLRWFLFALLGLVFILSICGGIYFFNEGMFVSIFGTSIYYRIERLFMWSNGSGLQLENALASIGSSGLLGHGFNKTPIYFPESSTDFIFAVFSSNFGFIGVLISLILFFLFDLYIFYLLRKKNNSIGKYILIGFLGMLLFQQIQNIGMTIGLFPITGITLPFISYGGSSLLSYMIIIGLITNIIFEKEKKYK